jgi:uncharacterized protein YbjT (DUF2867 family)
MKIIVNSGNIGTPVALQLAGAGAEVSLTVRAPKPNPELNAAGIKQVPFDIHKPDGMAKALEGYDALFSLTPLVEDFPEVALATIQAAKQAGIGKIVRSSAQGADPESKITLGRWHYAVEQAIEDSGIPFTILRPGHFMQNYVWYGAAHTIKTQGVFYSSIGSVKMSPIDARDISAAAAATLLEPGHEGKRYTLTGAESLSDDDIAIIASQALGRPVSHVSIPEAGAVDAMAQAGMPGWLVNLLSELNGLTRAGYFSEVQPDATMILKRKPIVFSQFIQDHLAAFTD